MTREEFISELKNRGAILMPTVSDRAIELVQNGLQTMRAAMMSLGLIDIYKTIGGGMILGDANIFGPEKIDRVSANYELPDIVQINRDVANIGALRGKTIIGRNQMFWFAFDAFGNFYMLDILNFRILRKYENDPYRAIIDCLAVGKI
ncbi:MAG: hypothetical protein FWF34_01430 [Alphaproteobacteria bacterium]|nr:hypothetical protein [Alphaproteobacteria bacterium]MCL2889902.1 hypothetical protein [Alphaproteobacteria bacterium]